MKKITLFIGLSLCFYLADGQINDRNLATIHFEILNAANEQKIPAKLVVYRDEMPYTKSWILDDHLVQGQHTIYTANGRGTIKIASGDYEFWFSKGMEYSAEERFIRVKNRGEYHLTIRLKKELQTPHLIAGDLHLHASTYSKHGDDNLPERIISGVAEGLEWVVATDHHQGTDYKTMLDSLGVLGKIATTVGHEVRTKIGHFNTYPSTSNSSPVEVPTTNANELFSDIRQKASDSVLIQVNHPQDVLSDYFNTKALDIYFGTTEHPEWSWDFDAIEIWNNNGLLGWNIGHDNKFSVKKHWFNLLNHGHHICGVGNSDSHTEANMIAGIPRNYILSSTDDPAKMDEKELVANIKAQKVIVAQGILPNMTANQKYGVGETLSLEKDQLLNLHLHVQAASWIDCNKAELIENGKVIQTFVLTNEDKVVRLDTTIQIRPTKDSWYILIASGDKEMSPVMKIAQEPIYPLGFTNPIWVDMDNDGRITSIFDHSEQQLKQLGHDDKALLAALQIAPETIPYTVYFLIKNQYPNTFSLLEALLRTDQTDQKLMLFRELSKMNHETAINLLKAQLTTQLTPLEEVVLYRYIHFPLFKTRLEIFKNKTEETLNQQLSLLETQFVYVYENAQKKTFQVAATDKLATELTETEWKTVALRVDGMLSVSDLPEDLQHRKIYIKQTFNFQNDTLLHAYLRTNRMVEIFRNGESLGYLKNNLKVPMEQKLFPIPMQQGENELLIQVEIDDKLNFSFMEVRRPLR